MTVLQLTAYNALCAAGVLWYGPLDFISDAAAILTDVFGNPIEPWMIGSVLLIGFGANACILIAGWIGRLTGRIGKDDTILD